MCHSVEMYLPQITRSAAEQRIGQADFAAAERERRAVEAGLGVIGWLKRFAGYLSGGGRVPTRGCLPNILKYNRNRFKRVLWLGRRESQEPVVSKVRA